MDDEKLASLKPYLRDDEFTEAVSELADYKAHKGRSKKWRQSFGGEHSNAKSEDAAEAVKSPPSPQTDRTQMELTPRDLLSDIVNILKEALIYSGRAE